VAGRWRTVGDALDPKHNSLNFLRLVLALIVLMVHTAQAGWFVNIKLGVGTTSLGQIAVYGFFGISGYLIAGSAMKNKTGRYLWQRGLRILPAFWVCLLVTAFIFGVIAWISTAHTDCALGCYFSSSNGPLQYAYRNWFLFIHQTQISGTPSHVPLPLQWDPSLWTLYYEFACYLMLGILAVIGLLRRRVVTLIGTAILWLSVVFITFTPVWQAEFDATHNWTAMNMIKFATVFLVGSVIYLYRDRVPDSGWLALGTGGLFVGGLLLPTHGLVDDYHFTASFIFAPLFAYPVLWLGAHLPFERVGAVNDYSYGIYIYAWPVSQVLAIWGVFRWGYLPYTLLTIVATLPMAIGSWWLIEKRALSLKRLTLFRVRSSIPSPLPANE
jgi:peptidoglycan/LPS O-acetylase OafA/YrhL